MFAEKSLTERNSESEAEKSFIRFPVKLAAYLCPASSPNNKVIYIELNSIHNCYFWMACVWWMPRAYITEEEIFNLLHKYEHIEMKCN